MRFFELRNLMIGSVVFTLTFVLGWLLGVGSSAPLVAGNSERAQITLTSDAPARP